MSINNTIQVTAIERAIEDLERLTHDAIASLRGNEKLNKKVIERAVLVGNAQAAGELVYAALIACKTPVRPDSVELVVDTKGFNHDRVTEKASAAATRTFVRRIKDNY